MKYLTREVYDALANEEPGGREQWHAALAAYQARIEELGNKLGPALKRCADAYYVHDALISRVFQESSTEPLNLVLRRGNLLIGYYDLKLTYLQPEISPEHLAMLAEIASVHRGSRRFGAIDAYAHEVDVLRSGRFEHRILFHGELWIVIRADEIRVEEVLKLDRQLAPYRHRIRLPQSLEELRQDLPTLTASSIHSYHDVENWLLPFFERDGFARVEDTAWWETLEPIRRYFHSQPPAAGRRGILRIPEVAGLANSPRLLRLVELILGPDARVVRGIFFDKTPEANWKVPWHQDVTIAVGERHDVEGFGPWSVKDGVPHVQPPAWILERMLTVRIHLDDCRADNGALKVIPGSHSQGKLSASQIAALAKEPAAICEAEEGDALLMRPLLLHASSPAEAPRHRRVIHLEYAAAELPPALEWATETPL